MRRQSHLENPVGRSGQEDAASRCFPKEYSFGTGSEKARCQGRNEGQGLRMLGVRCNISKNLLGSLLISLKRGTNCHVYFTFILILLSSPFLSPSLHTESFYYELVVFKNSRINISLHVWSC